MLFALQSQVFASFVTLDQILNICLMEASACKLISSFCMVMQGVEMHAPSGNLSGSAPVFKQAAQSKFSPLISVV